MMLVVFCVVEFSFDCVMLVSILHYYLGAGLEKFNKLIF